MGADPEKVTNIELADEETASVVLVGIGHIGGVVVTVAVPKFVAALVKVYEVEGGTVVVATISKAVIEHAIVSSRSSVCSKIVGSLTSTALKRKVCKPMSAGSTVLTVKVAAAWSSVSQVGSDVPSNRTSPVPSS